VPLMAKANSESHEEKKEKKIRSWGSRN